MLRSGLLTSYLSGCELQIMYVLTESVFREAHEGCLCHDKNGSDKTYIIRSSRQLELEVERLMRSLLMGRKESNQTNKSRRRTTFLFFAILYDKRNIFSFLCEFCSLHIQS